MNDRECGKPEVACDCKHMEWWLGRACCLERDYAAFYSAISNQLAVTNLSTDVAVFVEAQVELSLIARCDKAKESRL